MDEGKDGEWMAIMIKDDRLSGSADEAGDPYPDMPVVQTMIISKWLESGHTKSFRARITYRETPGIAQSAVSTADPDEVLRVVQGWLAGQPGNAGR